MSNFDEVVEVAVRKGGDGVPGAIMIGKDKTGKTLISKIAGYSSVSEDAKPLQIDAVYKIASCTKLITTIATLQCVERGLIALDDCVYDILPELKDSQIISSPDEDFKTLEFRKHTSPITVRHLLSHSSGIAYDSFHPTIKAWRASRGEEPLCTTGTVPEAFTLPLLFEPGQGWMYGGGIDWAGKIVQRLNNNISLEKYFNENIWGRLGLTAPFPTFDLNKHLDMKARLVQTAMRREDGSLEPGYTPFAESPADECGGQGLALTAPDLMAVLVDLIADKPKLLKPETIHEMISPQFAEDSAALQGLKDGESIYGPMTAHAAPEDAVNQGLGALLITKDVRSLGVPKNTLAWGGLTNIWWMINRDKGFAGLYTGQILPSDDEKSIGLMQTFFTEFLQKLAADKKI